MAFRLLLRLSGGPTRFPVGTRPTVLGSASDSDIHVDHPSISQRHARLHMTDDGLLLIEDLGSSNGTFLDGRRISGTAAAPLGRHLAFGNVSAELEQVSDGDAQAAFSLGDSPTPPPSDRTEPVADHATVASSVLEEFSLRALPEILDAVEQGMGVQVVAERLGAAFWRGFPTGEVKICDRGAPDAGTCFMAGEPPGAEASRWVTVEEQDDHFSIRVTFRSRGVAKSFAAVARLSLQLLSLAKGRVSPSGRRLDFHDPPPVPDPPSVTLRVREIYQRAARIAGSPVNVLVLGESGTGKEVLSRYIHRAGKHGNAPFVALNCAALPKDLLEAELFGIEKGVATGVEARPGKFELADGGTLFLDEVGDMALETQAKILRVLQERTVYRLGGKQVHPIDIQVVSATNRDLGEMIRNGTFRGDLFYRLAGWEIQLPPLRRRRGDIPNLAIHFFKQEAQRLGLTKVGISMSAMEALKSYAWPGNIRELHHEIVRGVLLLSEGDLLESSHLRPALLESSGPSGSTLEEALEQAERKCILEAIEASDGSMEDITALLGVSRSTLYRRMRALGIEREAGD